MADSKGVNEGSNADRIAAIRQRAEHGARLSARLIASAHLLDVPFSDAPEQSPWTRMVPYIASAREVLKKDVPWLLDAFDAAEARAEKAERTLAVLRELHTGSHECPSEEDNCGWWSYDDCPTLTMIKKVADV